MLAGMSQLDLFSPRQVQPSVLSVAELTFHIRDVIEGDELLQDVWVKGEISNFSRPRSGHWYFTVKDSEASLRCVMWRNLAMNQLVVPQDGDEVEVHGSIGVYEVGGQYQLYVDNIRQGGEGELFAEFMRIKAQLEAEGLFEPARKRSIPVFPKRIGVVTSPTGAALQDILNTLRRRFPLAEVVLAPSMVQGDAAPKKIIQALKNLASYAQPDVIILARGGGSIEDLWAFNDERVARTVAEMPVPVITGVGHETDFTIVDFVSDLRAPTPTAAAELASPDVEKMLFQLTNLRNQIEVLTADTLSGLRWGLESIQNRVQILSPRSRLMSQVQRMDEISMRLGREMEHLLSSHMQALKGIGQQLGALDPKAILQRGFAVLLNSEGKRVRSVTDVSEQEKIAAYLSDGSLRLQVDAVEKEGENDGNKD